MFVDKVISISEYELALLVKNHGPNKVVLLKNSVSGSNEIIDFERKRSVFLFVGRLDEQKGIDELLRFWGENSPESLDVIGDSVRGTFSKSLIEGVKYHGWVETSEPDAFYANAEAVMFRSVGVKELGFYSHDFPHAEDYECFSRFINAYKAFNIPKALVNVEINLAGILIKNRSKQVITRLKIQLHMLDVGSVNSILGLLKTLTLLVIPYFIVLKLKNLLGKAG
jgi:glycosyltransferase involved in cell wall biosynthesis